ncbi:MAG: cytidylate kinase-like family protein [Bacteroidota bacterium]
MRIDLKKYLSEQYQKSIDKDVEPGPVITISREYGCSAKELAAELVNQLSTEIASEKGWTWINKEIFEDTAKSLNLKQNRIKHVFEGKKMGLVDSVIMSSAERYYKSDITIKKKMIEIVRSFAEKGNIIIIGLGSGAICRNIKKSLHIRLQAPFKWRVKKTSEKRNKNIDEVTKYAKDIDKKRDMLRKSFELKEGYDELFDLTFNVMTMRYEEIAEIIVFTMKKRELI